MGKDTLDHVQPLKQLLGNTLMVSPLEAEDNKQAQWEKCEHL